MNGIPRQALMLYLLAALSSVGTLGFYYVGEEGILTITSLEMWQRGDWMRLWMYGGDAQHGVFANWLIIPLASLIGWEHVLAAARAVMVIATLATGLVVYGLLRRLGRDAGFAALAAVIYITFADVLLYRGWLAYRDPLFGFLVFAAIAALWIGARESRLRWFAACGVLAFAAYLTKGITAYVFVGSAVLVLLAFRETRPALLRPGSWGVAAGSLALLMAWMFGVQSGSTQALRYGSEIGAKLVPPGIGAWLLKLLSYPAETIVRLLPASGFALYLYVRSAAARAGLHSDTVALTAAWIALLGFLPYWFAPHSHFRYLLPIVPLAAIVFAALIAQGSEGLRRNAWRAMWLVVAVKIVVVVIAFPQYQQRYRGANYAEAAAAILQRTTGHTLYTTDVSASGLAVTAHLDILRLPQPALMFPPAEWSDGFVIAYEPDPKLGTVAVKFRLGGNELYLLCRGAACAAQPAEGLRK
jgi:4-amino-4-deoxy-L-arabinose transferase-like glycosyltransferase